MQSFLGSDLHINGPAAASHSISHMGPGEEPGDDGDGLELPVNPDEGTPLIPDEEGGGTAPA